jgi:undecaprenyl-diphosphatase
MTQLAPAPCTEAAQVNISFAELGVWRIIVLGIVQGITELLPISSTAHLRIIPSLFGWPDPGSAFYAAMKMASLLAVVTFLGGDVLRITRRATTAAQQGDWKDHSLLMTIGIVLGTLPIAVAGLLLRKTLEGCGSLLRGLTVVGWACVIMGVLLALAERYGQRNRGHAKRQWAALGVRDCVAVGLAQMFALVPGVSRSGSTLTAGLALGMERATAAWFSFLLGLPALRIPRASPANILFLRIRTP